MIMTPLPRRPISPANGSRGLAVGLKILTHLRKEGRPMSLKELAVVASLGKPSTLRLLRTLESLGYVSRDGSKNYRLEAEPSLTTMRDNLSLLRETGKRYCQGLQKKCGETVTLGYLFGDHIRVVEVIESAQHIRMSNFVGRILQPYASSLGKAIAAYQEEEERQKLLDVYGIYRLTKNTLVEQLAIQNEFAMIRERGYAEDREETVEGGYCLATPIRGPERNVIAAISISFPKFRVPTEVLERFPSMLQQATHDIGAALRNGAQKSLANPV